MQHGDGRCADGILWSVQYAPICRHVLSIPSSSLSAPAGLELRRLRAYRASMLMPRDIVASVPR